MATVVKCDQCGNVDRPSVMKQMNITVVGNDNTDRPYESGNTHAGGDFCSQKCITEFIEARLIDLWYNRYHKE